MKELIQEFKHFLGLRQYEDPTKAPPGSAREMVNMILTDRGGIRKRPGTELLGPYDSTFDRCRGFFVFRKTDSVTEIPVKAVDNGTSVSLKYYHSSTNTWPVLKSGYTTGADFGFIEGFTMVGNDDHMYFGNRYEPDSRWTGVITQLNGALVGGETAITVDSVLRPDVYYTISLTFLSASSATTVTHVSSNPWVTDQWKNFYILPKSGVHAGKIRKITGNTANVLTFDTFGSDPGTVVYEIRLNAFPVSGNVYYNGIEVAYTDIPTETTFTVASASAAPDNTPLTLSVSEYPGNPKGNRMALLRGRRYVGNVRSGMNITKTAGLAQPGSVYVSKVVNATNQSNDLTDFGASSPRSAGEGDIIASTYGGEGFVDLVEQDDAMYLIKPYSIESLKYTQDTSDIAQLQQISTGYGSATQVIKGGDDVFFVTSDKQFTSLGRVRQRDSKETSLNIGLPVKRLLESYSYDRTSRGREFQNRVHIPVKGASTDTNTNRLLVYNRNGAFEGEWWLSVDHMGVYGNSLYASMSNNANVVKLYTGLNDKLGSSVSDSDEYPISCKYTENWLNLTRTGFNMQEVNLFAVEGYILGDTEINFNLYKDFELSPFLSFTFSGTDDQVDQDFQSRFLGSLPVGLEPLGAISTSTDIEGMRHFMFMVYFPFQHAEWISWEVTNSGLDQKFEIIRAGMNFKEDTILDFGNRIKQLT